MAKSSARNASTPALLDVRKPFVDALAAHTQEGLNLLSAVETALQVGNLSPAVADILRERAAAFRRTLLGGES